MNNNENNNTRERGQQFIINDCPMDTGYYFLYTEP